MPRASWRRVVAALAVAAPVGAGAADKAPAANEQELRELRARISKMQTELVAAEKSSGAASEEVRASAKAVSEAHRALFALAQERRSIEAEVVALGARERDARAGVAVQEELAARMLRIQYRQGAPDRLRLALQGRDPATVARHMEYYNYIQRARAELIAELRRRGEEIAELASLRGARLAELARRPARRGDRPRAAPDRAPQARRGAPREAGRGDRARAGRKARRGQAAARAPRRQRRRRLDRGTRVRDPQGADQASGAGRARQPVRRGARGGGHELEGSIHPRRYR